MKNKNRYWWFFRLPNGKASKSYRSYMGAYKAAHKLYPIDTERMLQIGGLND